MNKLPNINDWEKINDDESGQSFIYILNNLRLVFSKKYFYDDWADEYKDEYHYELKVNHIYGLFNQMSEIINDNDYDLQQAVNILFKKFRSSLSSKIIEMDELQDKLNLIE